MNAPTIIAKLTARGIRLEADGEKLRWHPRAALAADEIAMLREHKRAIVATLTAGDAENSFPPGDVLPAPAAPRGNGPAIPVQSDPPTEKSDAAKWVNSHDLSEFDPTARPVENRPSNRIFDVGATGAAGTVDGMPWPAAWGDSAIWSAAEREALQERAAIREFDGGMARADAERAALGDVRPASRPGGLIDALAADGLLHPGGTITTHADGRRAWQHLDFDGDECAKAMISRPAELPAEYVNPQTDTNPNTRTSAKDGAA